MTRRCLLFAVAPALAAQTFTIDHYAKVFRVTEPRLAPSGRSVVYVLARPNYEANAWESEIMQADLGTRENRPLTSRKTASHPRFSPSGDRLAFSANVDGKPQIFVLPVGGGEAVQITRSPTGILGFAWKPDGSAFAYIAQVEAPKRSKNDDAFEVNANDYLTLAAPRPFHIWMVPAQGGEARRLADGDWSVPALMPSLAWSPDGTRIAFTKQSGAGTRDWEKRSISWMEVSSGRIEPFRGIESRHCGAGWFSPDGQRLLVSCPVGGHVKNQSELGVVPAGGGEFRLLTGAIDRNFGRGFWSGDSKSIVATAADGTGTGLWTIPLDGPAQRRSLGKLNPSDLDVGADGTIAFVASSDRRPPELYVWKPGEAAPTRLTDIHSEVAALKLGAMESMTWKSDDGLPLSGVLTFPPEFDASKKYPLLLVIHGGPWGSSRQVFSTRAQLMAGKGWIVFEPNYRGSDNHGNALYSAVYRDHGAGPGRDVMAGLDALKKRPYVDAARIGVSGWSYGGYMTTWLIGHYQGWRAAMAGAAVIDLVDDYNLNDLSLYIRAYGDTLTLPKDLELMKEQSPMTYVDNMKTPLLLLSDTGDVRVPVTQSYKLYNALKERGQDVRMILWPVPGHFPADPYRSRDVDQKWAEYFEQRLR